MELKIKAGNIANLTDARYFAAKEVSFLGFCLDNADENFQQPIVVKAIKEWIEGPLIVGEFGMQSTEEILALVEQVGLDAVQLGYFSQADMSILKEKTNVFREIIIEKTSTAAEIWENTERFGAESDALILDFEKNNIAWEDIIRSQAFDIELLQRICQRHKVFLSLKFKPSQLKSIVNILQPEGISLKGGEEEKVGIKSFDELDDIFDVIEE